MSSVTEGEEFWRAHIAAWHRSGQRRPAYCAAHELILSRFNYWERRLRHEFRPPVKREPAEPLTFVPVNIIDPPVAPQSVRVGTSLAVIEVLIAGMTVRVPTDADEASLRRVLLVARSLT